MALTNPGQSPGQSASLTINIVGRLYQAINHIRNIRNRNKDVRPASISENNNDLEGTN